MISLYRELPFQLKIRGQFFLFRFAAGYSKTVDPQSGMTVNLKYLNSWLEALRGHCQDQDFTSPCEILQVARSFLKALAVAQQASLERVQIQFENQDLLSQDSDEKFEFQKSWWVTEMNQAKRVQIIATFPVLIWADVERLQNLILAGNYRSRAQELFLNFPIEPILIEVRDPLTGASMLSLV